MSSKHEEIVARYYAAFNARDLEAYARLFTPDCEVRAPGVSARGVDATRQFDQVWFEAFPAARIEALKMVAAGGALATANVLHGGPQRGVLRSPAGDVPPTGREFVGPYCSYFEFEGERIKLQSLHFAPEFVPRVLGLTG